MQLYSKVFTLPDINNKHTQQRQLRKWQFNDMQIFPLLCLTVTFCAGVNLRSFIKGFVKCVGEETRESALFPAAIWALFTSFILTKPANKKNWKEIKLLIRHFFWVKVQKTLLSSSYLISPVVHNLVSGDHVLFHTRERVSLVYIITLHFSARALSYRELFAWRMRNKFLRDRVRFFYAPLSPTFYSRFVI